MPIGPCRADGYSLFYHSDLFIGKIKLLVKNILDAEDPERFEADKTTFTWKTQKPEHSRAEPASWLVYRFYYNNLRVASTRTHAQTGFSDATSMQTVKINTQDVEITDFM